MIHLMLLLNQKNMIAHPNSISLSQKHNYDNIPWEELLKKNREQLAKRFLKK